MATQRIDVEINQATGELEIEVKGVRGKSCRDVSKFLLDALAGRVVESKDTPDAKLPPLREAVAAGKVKR